MVIKNNEGRQKMKIGQVRGIIGLLLELRDYEFGSRYWSTCLSKKVWFIFFVFKENPKKTAKFFRIREFFVI